MNTRIKDHPLRSLIQAKHIKEEIDVQSVGTPNMYKVSQCPARKFQCKTCNKYGHFTSLCYKKWSSFLSGNPKAYQLQAGVVYVQEDSICMASQVIWPPVMSLSVYEWRLQCTQANTKISHTSSSYYQSCLQIEATPQEKSVAESQIRYMCWCKHNVQPVFTS